MRKIHSQRRSRLHKRSAFAAAAEIDCGCCRGHSLVRDSNLIEIYVCYPCLSIEKWVKVLEYWGGIGALEDGKGRNGGAGSDRKGVLLHTDAEKIAVLGVRSMSSAREQSSTAERRDTVRNVNKRLH